MKCNTKLRPVNASVLAIAFRWQNFKKKPTIFPEKLGGLDYNKKSDYKS